MPTFKKIVVSGSAVSQLTNDAGYLIGAGGILSSSAQIASDISGAFTSTSSSIATTAASIAGRVTTLEGTGTIQGVGTTDNVTFANVTATGNVSITGTLFVDGTTTTVNSTNLNIEDKFILLNSGSTGGSPTEGGIIVESGSTGTGNAFYYDSTENRWSLKAGASGTTGGLTAEAFMSTVILASTASVQSGVTYYKAGNIVINASGIFILDDQAEALNTRA